MKQLENNSFSAHLSHWHKRVFPFLRWFLCKWTEFNKKWTMQCGKVSGKGLFSYFVMDQGWGAANDEKSLWGGFESPYAWFPIEFHFWVKCVNNEDWRRCFQGTRLMHSRTCLHCGDSKILSWNLSGGKIKTIVCGESLENASAPKLCQKVLV